MSCPERNEATCTGDCEWKGGRCITKRPFLSWIVSMRAEPRPEKIKKALLIVCIFTVGFVVFRALWVHTVLRFTKKLSPPN